MNEPLRILLCDDRETIAEDYADDIRGAAGNVTVTALSGKLLSSALTGLRARARAAFAGKPAPQEALPFDDCDVCLVDNSLLFLDPDAGDGAEAIFGLIRAFTRCEYTISINLDPFTDFDLRLLGGHPETVADLALNERHLALKSVWDRSAGGFAPSWWPDIRRVVAKREARRRSILNHAEGLDGQIWSFFGFDQNNRADGLQDTALGYLDPEAETTGNVQTTFANFFVRAARSLPAKEEDRLKLLELPEVAVRVIEAELSTWLARMVAAPQSTLVDAAHLVIRTPVLVPEPRTDTANWDAVAVADEPPFGMDPELFGRHVQPAWFNAPGAPNGLEAWGDRPLFWWPDLREDDELGRLDLAVQDLPNLVYAEDLSRFVSSDDQAPPRSFLAAFRTSWDERFVSAGVDGFRYAPRSLLAR